MWAPFYSSASCRNARARPLSLQPLFRCSGNKVHLLENMLRTVIVPRSLLAYVLPPTAPRAAGTPTLGLCRCSYYLDAPATEYTCQRTGFESLLLRHIPTVLGALPTLGSAPGDESTIAALVRSFVFCAFSRLVARSVYAFSLFV